MSFHCCAARAAPMPAYVTTSARGISNRWRWSLAIFSICVVMAALKDCRSIMGLSAGQYMNGLLCWGVSNAHLLEKPTARKRSTLSAAWQLSWMTALNDVSLAATLGPSFMGIERRLGRTHEVSIVDNAATSQALLRIDDDWRCRSLTGSACGRSRGHVMKERRSEESHLLT